MVEGALNMKPGDIVQIIDTEHHWFPCLITVTEPKSWGIQGYVTFPMHVDGELEVVQAYIRLNTEQILKVGKAKISGE